MKRIFRRVRLFLVAGLVMSFIVALAYSAGLLTFTNNLNVGSPAVNLFAEVVTTSTCPAPPTGYTDSSLSLTWSLTQGTSQSQDVCVFNSGTASSHALTVSFNSGTSTGITMTSATNPGTLTGHSALFITITLTANSTATSGTGSTTTIS